MRRCLAVCLAGVLLPAFAAAQPPAPIDPVRFAFPGGVDTPASGTSAALALTDRWLGDEPFWNPAVPVARRVMGAPLAERVSRQDLRANNRDFDDTSGYFDLAGGWASWPLGRVALDAYVAQPELRFEDNAYTLGRLPQPGAAATVANHASVRELRAGAGLSAGFGRSRVGAALEWTDRSDDYTYHEESGSPNSGDQSVSFDGSGIGAQLGAHTDWALGARTIEVGAAARYRPKLTLDGTQTFDLFSGFSSNPVHVTRASSWEGGLSVRVPTAETFHVLAAVGGRGAEAWEGFDATAGARFVWSLAGEFHDPRDPWTLRFGGAAEQQRGVPEPRDGMFALGLGWRFTRATASFGVTHRTLARAGQPNSYDDRVVAGISVP